MGDRSSHRRARARGPRILLCLATPASARGRLAPKRALPPTARRASSDGRVRARLTAIGRTGARDGRSRALPSLSSTRNLAQCPVGVDGDRPADGAEHRQVGDRVAVGRGARRATGRARSASSCDRLDLALAVDERTAGACRCSGRRRPPSGCRRRRRVRGPRRAGRRTPGWRPSRGRRARPLLVGVGAVEHLGVDPRAARAPGRRWRCRRGAAPRRRRRSPRRACGRRRSWRRRAPTSRKRAETHVSRTSWRRETMPARAISIRIEKPLEPETSVRSRSKNAAGRVAHRRDGSLPDSLGVGGAHGVHDGFYASGRRPSARPAGRARAEQRLRAGVSRRRAR